MTEPVGLRRTLGFWQVTVTGVGIVIGAGIYVLIGEATRDAGGAVWAAFLFAALLSALTGLSYAELASVYPRAGAEYEFARRAFNEFTGFVIGWMMIAAYVIAAATVSLGFARYLGHFSDVNADVAAVALIAVLTLIVISGLERSIWLTVTLVVLQIGGLLMVITAGVPHIGDRSLVEGGSLNGVFGAAALLFFAFIGFDEVVTLSEETRDAGRVIPRALLTGLAISAALYVAVGVAAVSVVDAGELAESSRPLALVIAHDWGSRASDIVAVIALASTTNTTLLVLTSASRMLYGMARGGVLPSVLATVGRRGRAPYVAALLTAVPAAALAVAGELGSIAAATDFAVYVIFIAVNLSVIVLRFKAPDASRAFRVPWSVRGVPVPPLLGIASVVLMMAYLEPAAWAMGAAAMALGAVVWWLLALRR